MQKHNSDSELGILLHGIEIQDVDRELLERFEETHRNMDHDVIARAKEEMRSNF